MNSAVPELAALGDHLLAERRYGAAWRALFTWLLERPLGWLEQRLQRSAGPAAR